jgi:GNAT superfamily N-acetyltransferase
LAEIRPFEPADAAAGAALLADTFPQPAAVSAAAVLHWATSSPKRAHTRIWVAREGEALVAWADAQLKWSIAEEGIAEVYVAVDRTHRGQGIGRALYALAESHVLGHGARELWTFVREDEPEALAFVERRGFRERRREHSWALDLRKAEIRETPVPEGFRVARLGELRERVEDLFELYDSAHSDMPSDHAHALELEEWRRETFENPELDFDTSAVVLAGDRPVSFAWLTTDRETRRASHEMTGTHADFRGRGLARVAKEATIRWASEAGLEYLITSNDSTNSPMLGLNERLGYEPRQSQIELAKDV